MRVVIGFVFGWVALLTLLEVSKGTYSDGFARGCNAASEVVSEAHHSTFEAIEVDGVRRCLPVERVKEMKR